MNSETFVMFWSWPAVIINRKETEIQMFGKYFDKIDKKAVIKQMINISEDEEIKSKNVSNIFRKKGNKYYKDLDYAEALKMYNTSISRAPRDSVEFGLAVANRSAILFDMEKYKECSDDINTALRSEYPKELRYKIFLRLSKCYLKLNLNFEAAKSLRKAQECADSLKLGKLKKASINDKILEIKSQLKEQLQAKVSKTEPADDFVFTEPNLKDGENLKFLNSANVVDIKYTKQLGRHVVANTDIKQGDVLFMEKPYSFTAFEQPEDHINVCAFCLQRAINCIPCIVCTLYFYCTENCRQSAWDLSHRWECSGASRKIITKIEHQLCLSILFKASHDGFKTTVDDESAYGNIENNHPYVNKLLTHKTNTPDGDLQQYVQAAVWMVLYLKNFTDYFDWLYVYTSRPEGSKEELYKFIGGQLIKYLLQIKCNAMVIREGSAYCQSNKNLSFVQVGYGIFISTALLNHSCLPNAIQSFHDSTIIVKALKYIKKGTEITINYLDKNCYTSDIAERQSDLERYLFKCSCQACIDPYFDELRRPWLCPRCSGKAFRLQNEMKCSECHLVFCATEHYQNHFEITQLLAMYHLFGYEDILNEMYRLMKKTYHKLSTKYYLYYEACLKYYKKTGQIKKSVDIVKSYTEIATNLYGDTSEKHLRILLSYVFFLANHCISLRNQHSENYRKVYDETKAKLKQITNILQYYICTENIKIYLANVTKYINSGSIDQDIRYMSAFERAFNIQNSYTLEECYCRSRYGI